MYTDINFQLLLYVVGAADLLCKHERLYC